MKKPIYSNDKFLNETCVNLVLLIEKKVNEKKHDYINNACKLIDDVFSFYIPLDYPNETLKELRNCMYLELKKLAIQSFLTNIFVNNKNIKKEKKSVYIIQKKNGLVKIGLSKSPKKRIRAIETHGGENMVKKHYSENFLGANKVETGLHKIFKEKREQGEWFNIDFDEAVTQLSKIIPKTIVPMTDTKLIS